MSKSSFGVFWRGSRWPVRSPLLIELVSVMRYSRPLVPNAKVRRGDCGLRMVVKIFCNIMRVKRKRFDSRTKERGHCYGVKVNGYRLRGTGYGGGTHSSVTA